MNDTLLLVGTRDMARALGVGRDRVAAWVKDPAVNFPAAKTSPRGQWIASPDNLRAWARQYFNRSADKEKS